MIPEPFVSIIVPTYRRPARLADCLRSLAQLDYPHDRFEVVVVDDGSGAPPEDAVAAVAPHVQVGLLVVDHGGPAAARNAGAARAKGELLAFIDDDCTAAPGWLRAFAVRAQALDGCMLGGRIVNALSANPYSAASQLLVDYLYAQHNADPDDARFFASSNLAVPADAFRAVGGFDTSFRLAAAEDRELCLRWRRLGRRLAYVPDAVVRHAHDLTLRRFWRQHVNYGRGRCHLGALAARRRDAAVALETPAFYVRLVAYALRGGRGIPRASLTALLALSQLATAAGFLHERCRRTPP